MKNLDPEYSERYKEQIEYTKNKEYEKERKNLISKIRERIEKYYKLEEEHEKKHGVIFGNFDFYYDNGYLADKYSDEYEFIVLNPEHLLHILLNEDLEELLHSLMI